VTGIVGAAGGIGGFYLPNLLGVLRASTGTFASGFITFGALALFGAILITLRGRVWSGTFLLEKPTSYAFAIEEGLPTAPQSVDIYVQAYLFVPGGDRGNSRTFGEFR
jgi:hypothetical protein